MNITIRRVGIAEIARSAEVIRRAFGTVAEDLNLTKENCPTHGAFLTEDRLRLSIERGSIPYGLYEGDRQVGFFLLTSTEDGIYLEKVAVLPECRHMGYGRMLLNHARDEARAAGAQALYLSVNEFNARLKKWYNDYGFISTGTKVFAHLPFPVGFMKYSLCTEEVLHEALGRTV